MRKLFIMAISVTFLSAMLVSCKTNHTRCAAYGKINKIDTGKMVTNITEKDI